MDLAELSPKPSLLARSWIAHSRLAASSTVSGDWTFVELGCESLCSVASVRHARSKTFCREAGMSSALGPDATSSLSSSGLSNMNSKPLATVSPMNAVGSSTSSSDFKYSCMAVRSSGSRLSVVTRPSCDTLVRGLRSIGPSQSAARHEMRKLGFPRESSLDWISSIAVVVLRLPARVSSSPSMNNTLSSHSGWAVTSAFAKLRAEINSAASPKAMHSCLNSVVFPEPGSPSRT